LFVYVCLFKNWVKLHNTSPSRLKRCMYGVCSEMLKRTVVEWVTKWKQTQADICNQVNIIFVYGDPVSNRVVQDPGPQTMGKTNPDIECPLDGCQLLFWERWCEMVTMTLGCNGWRKNRVVWRPMPNKNTTRCEGRSIIRSGEWFGIWEWRRWGQKTVKMVKNATSHYPHTTNKLYCLFRNTGTATSEGNQVR